MKREFSEAEIEGMRNELCRMAQKQGRPVEEIRKLFEEYIDCAFSNPNPDVQKRLQTCPRKGELPTPEEFLLWFMPQVMDDLIP